MLFFVILSRHRAPPFSESNRPEAMCQPIRLRRLSNDPKLITCPKYFAKAHSIWSGIINALLHRTKDLQDGRIVIVAKKTKRRRQKRADYPTCYTRDFMIAVVEAKADYNLQADGLPTGKGIGGSTWIEIRLFNNGHGIIEFDYLSGQKSNSIRFPPR